MHARNRLWFDSQWAFLYIVTILAKIYIEIRNVDLVWQSFQILVPICNHNQFGLRRSTEIPLTCMTFRMLYGDVYALAAGGMKFHILMVAGRDEYIWSSNLVLILSDVNGWGITRLVGGIVDQVVSMNLCSVAWWLCSRSFCASVALILADIYYKLYNKFCTTCAIFSPPPQKKIANSKNIKYVY